MHTRYLFSRTCTEIFSKCIFPAIVSLLVCIHLICNQVKTATKNKGKDKKLRLKMKYILIAKLINTFFFSVSTFYSIRNKEKINIKLDLREIFECPWPWLLWLAIMHHSPTYMCPFFFSFLC